MNKEGKIMKKTDILRNLSGNNLEEIRGVIEHIAENRELQRIERFSDYCEFILTQIEEEAKLNTERQKTMHKAIYAGYIKKIKRIIENHGAPNRKNHLDDHAKRVLHALESPDYCGLLDNSHIAVSYGVVKAHYREAIHSDHYEKHLNHLHEILLKEKKARKSEPGIESKLD